MRAAPRPGRFPQSSRPAGRAQRRLLLEAQPPPRTRQRSRSPPCLQRCGPAPGPHPDTGPDPPALGGGGGEPSARLRFGRRFPPGFRQRDVRRRGRRYVHTHAPRPPPSPSQHTHAVHTRARPLCRAVLSSALLDARTPGASRDASGPHEAQPARSTRRGWTARAVRARRRVPAPARGGRGDTGQRGCDEARRTAQPASESLHCSSHTRAHRPPPFGGRIYL